MGAWEDKEKTSILENLDDINDYNTVFLFLL